MKKILILFISLFVMQFSTQAQEVENRRIGDFTEIKMRGNAELFLTKGDTVNLEIETREYHHQDRITTEVRGNTLYIYYERDYHNQLDFIFNPYPKYRVYLTYTELEEIDLEGRIRIQTEEPIQADDLELDFSGYITGEMTIYADELELDTEGYSNLQLDGEVFTAFLSMDGLGRVDALDLFTDRCEVDLEGSVKMEVYVRENLNAYVSGVSRIYYKGDPKTKKIRTDGFVRVRSCRG